MPNTQKHYSGFGPFRRETDNPRIYRIIRFRQKGKRKTIRTNVTLNEAQEHCSKPSTRGDGWFDGYDYMRGIRS